ncbi:hypothetical protein CRUP_024264, partial [Coryphaenoides rupestris]
GGSVTPEHCNALPNNNDNDQEVEEEEVEVEEEEEEEAACEDSPEGSQRQQNRQQHHIGDRSDRSDSSSSSSSSHEHPRSSIETSEEPAVDNVGPSPQSDRREIPAAARSPAAGCRAREEEEGVYGERLVSTLGREGFCWT